MHSIRLSTKVALEEYVRRSTSHGKNWEENAKTICHLVETGFISEKNISYDSDGMISSIRGTEVRDGIVQLKEIKKKVAPLVVFKEGEKIPYIEELRNGPIRRRAVAI